MHASKLDHSPPMQRVLALFKECGLGESLTTSYISENAHVENAATWVSALRRNGYDIRCEYAYMTQAGGRVYRYRLVAEPKP